MYSIEIEDDNLSLEDDGPLLHALKVINKKKTNIIPKNVLFFMLNLLRIMKKSV